MGPGSGLAHFLPFVCMLDSPLLFQLCPLGFSTPKTSRLPVNSYQPECRGTVLFRRLVASCVRTTAGQQARFIQPGSWPAAERIHGAAQDPALSSSWPPATAQAFRRTPCHPGPGESVTPRGCSVEQLSLPVVNVAVQMATAWHRFGGLFV